MSPRLRPLLLVAAAAGLAVLPAAARAQVGYQPAASPYTDLEYHQDLSAIVGWYHAKRDPAGVAPQSGLLTGVQYEWRAGGPAYLQAELGRINSQRLVIDPTKPSASRNLGTRSDPLYALDLSAALALTGFRSWHQLQPMVKGGVGVVSDFRGTDAGGFDYGTRFAFSWGGGVRWVPGGRWAFRADINNRLHTISYPESYYVPPTSGGGAVLSAAQSRSLWANDAAFTIGITYQFSR